MEGNCCCAAPCKLNLRFFRLYSGHFSKSCGFLSSTFLLCLLQCSALVAAVLDEASVLSCEDLIPFLSLGSAFMYSASLCKPELPPEIASVNICVVTVTCPG